MKVISGNNIFQSEAWDDEHMIVNAAESWRRICACDSDALLNIGLEFVQTSFEHPGLFPVLEIFMSQINSALIERGQISDTLFCRLEQLQELYA